MSTEYQIKANYNAANRTASELESIASSLVGVANSNLEATLSALRGAWSGENAERFLQKAYSVKNQILTTAKEIRSSASRLREAARNTYNSEMRALEIARQAKKASENASFAKQNGGSASGGSGGGGGSSWGGGGGGGSR